MSSSRSRHIERAADVRVGTPLDRETIRTTETGFLAVCADHHCSWQGLFPSREMASEAVETHVERARRSPDYQYHYGSQYPFIVELLDDTTARVCPDQDLEPLKPWKASYDGHGLTRAECGRPPLDEELHRGDLLECHGPGDGMVLQVSRTRSFGLPAFSIVYVSPEAETNEDGSYREADYRYLNEYVARDGEAVRVPDSDRLSFLGQTDAQSDLRRWN
ncbi:hypothetical protein [Haloarcula halophila]|uniref:hypothetical protein n=1 Tax=Haloarcula TaxID=2237 RepID=UPI0023E45776|nr:hypothetical protein [Halomicroarcula sp. DFY41]